VVQEIYALYVHKGYSLCRLAHYLQEQGVPTPSGKTIWSLATLRAILRQPAYTGKVYAGRYRYREARIRRSATHPLGTPHQTAVEVPPEEWIFVANIAPIISQETFDLAQARLAQNKSFATRNNTAHQYLLRALVSCGICQASCTCRALDKGKYRYYVCAGKAKAIHSRREEKCPSRFAPARQLDDLVWQDLCAVLRHPEAITHALERAQGGHWLPQELQARRDNLRKSRVRLEKQQDRLTEAYLTEVIPLAEYQRRRGEIEQKIQAFERQAEQLVSQVNRQHEIVAMVSSVEDFCQRVGQGLENASFAQQRQLIELLIDRVIVTDEDVEIRYVVPTNPEGEHIRFCHLRTDYRHHLHPSGQAFYLPRCYPGCLHPCRARLGAQS